MKTKAEQVSFKFHKDYKVFTNYPYTKWTVRWGCTVIAEYNFPKASDWQPERTVTIARARDCFNRATISVEHHYTGPIMK